MESRHRTLSRLIVRESEYVLLAPEDELLVGYFDVAIIERRRGRVVSVWKATGDFDPADRAWETVLEVQARGDWHAEAKGLDGNGRLVTEWELTGSEAASECAHAEELLDRLAADDADQVDGWYVLGVTDSATVKSWLEGRILAHRQRPWWKRLLPSR